MLDELGCAVMSLFVDRCSLQAAQLLFDALQKAAATVAIVVGGVWVYFRFVSGRTLKRRLECDLSADAVRSGGKVRLIVAAKAANVGLAKALVDREDTGLRVLTQAAEGFPESAVELPSAATAPAAETPPEGAASSGVSPTSSTGEAEVRPGGEDGGDEPSEYLARWQLLDTLPVFAETELLEPGERAIDQPLVEIPDGGFHAVRLELWVASPRRRLPPGGEKRWRTTAVVRVVGGAARVDNEGDPAGKGPGREGA